MHCCIDPLWFCCLTATLPHRSTASNYHTTPPCLPPSSNCLTTPPMHCIPTSDYRTAPPCLCLTIAPHHWCTTSACHTTLLVCCILPHYLADALPLIAWNSSHHPQTAAFATCLKSIGWWPPAASSLSLFVTVDCQLCQCLCNSARLLLLALSTSTFALLDCLLYCSSSLVFFLYDALILYSIIHSY